MAKKCKQWKRVEKEYKMAAYLCQKYDNQHIYKCLRGRRHEGDCHSHGSVSCFKIWRNK